MGLPHHNYKYVSLEKNVFLLSLEKKTLGEKCFFQKMQRTCSLCLTVKNRQKSTFFLRASKKGLSILSKHCTSCYLKVCRGLLKKIVGLAEHILIIL